jgi:hypothetical protein
VVILDFFKIVPDGVIKDVNLPWLLGDFRRIKDRHCFGIGKIKLINHLSLGLAMLKTADESSLSGECWYL